MFCSLLTEADAGHTEFTDEVFENETRFPGGDWKPAGEPYTDVVNVQHMHESTHVQTFTCFQKLWTLKNVIDKRTKACLITFQCYHGVIWMVSNFFLGWFVVTLCCHFSVNYP